jgi:hypothetical protein
MDAGRLTPLQVAVLRALAGLTPRWTLSGGGALAGVHTRHRATRDLDLFFQRRRSLGAVTDAVQARLESAKLAVAVVQSAEAFCRLDVRDASDAVIVDLVADPVVLAESPIEVDLAGALIQVDTPHQILVNKLCALLSRSELRDLVDVQALLAAGGDLRRALADAPEQDGGFSPLTFAYSLRQLPVEKLAGALGWTHEATAELQRFRAELVDRVLEEAIPA